MDRCDRRADEVRLDVERGGIRRIIEGLLKEEPSTTWTDSSGS
jgi:hypothetical protein